MESEYTMDLFSQEVEENPKKKKGKSSKDAVEIGTSKELYNFLYEACNILRGPVSHENFKDYITPLLYFKRISDCYDEETQIALEESGGDEEYAAFPEQHRFVIPDGCHWDDIRNRTQDLGSAIVLAMRQIELANPTTLYGVLSVFSTSNWSNKSILSDAKLMTLIEHMSKRRLGNNDYPADLMGDAYEILLKQFADESKKKAGEFYTPRSVVKLLVRILAPQPGETVYDPACGSGGMLIEAINYMHGDSLCCGAIFGQEKNVTNAAVAKMNLFLHGASDFHVFQGDTLREPMILQNDRLAKFDCVIANPPFSLKAWGATEWASDKYGRNLWGTPGDGNGDFAWLQHMVKSMKASSGRMAVVLPQGVLSRGGTDGTIREKIVREGIVDTVIMLGSGLFYGTNLPPCILILSRNIPAERIGHVLMIDASKIYTPQRAQNELSENDVDKIFNLYKQNCDVENFCKKVPYADIINEDFDLTPKIYIDYTPAQLPDPEELEHLFRIAVDQVTTCEANFRNIMNLL